jgi:hypothetical protein
MFCCFWWWKYILKIFFFLLDTKVNSYSQYVNFFIVSDIFFSKFKVGKLEMKTFCKSLSSQQYWNHQFSKVTLCSNFISWQEKESKNRTIEKALPTPIIFFCR